MALVIVTGGTTGATNGTPVSAGNPLTFTLSGVVSAHMRSEGLGTDDLDFDLPVEIEVSFDYGNAETPTWYDSLDAIPPRTVLGTNVPVWFRQSVAATVASSSFDTNGNFDIDFTAPTLSGTLTATPGDGQVVLDWADATDNVGVVGYDVDWGTTTAYGSSVSPDPTASTATITGLTAGVTYYFRVRAYDAAGNTTGYLTASAAPVSQFWSDDFSDNSINTTLWGTSATGDASVTETGGELVLSGGTLNANKAIAYAKQDVKRSIDGRFTVGVRQADTSTNGNWPFALYQSRQTDASTFNVSTDWVFGVSVEGTGQAYKVMAARYYNAAGSARFWVNSSWLSGATLSGSDGATSVNFASGPASVRMPVNAKFTLAGDATEYTLTAQAAFSASGTASATITPALSGAKSNVAVTGIDYWHTAYTALPFGDTGYQFDTNDTGDISLEIDAANTRWRYIITHNQHSRTITTSWMALSDLLDNGQDALAFYTFDHSDAAILKSNITAVTYAALT